jgi:solute carrier family 10 (sodium/bile acid cotransporter), member 7
MQSSTAATMPGAASLLDRIAGALRRIRPDWFVLSLVCTVLAATLYPCRDTAATVFHALGTGAIASLFFLQGARLSREAVLGGITHWRLHATIAATTFIVFPAIGLALNLLFPKLLPQTLWLGVLFLCTLPSTVQSSIALTSIAQGNVAGALCSATASNLAGIVLTPVLFGAIAHLRGGGIAIDNIGEVVAELLVPFVLGHLSRPWIGHWAAQNRRLLAFTDRSSILLVVYAAFSAAVVNGVWHQLPPVIMTSAMLGVALLLAAGLLAAALMPYVAAFDKPDSIAVLFCGSQKSLVSGVPIANVLFPASVVGPALIPIMIYYPMQLLVCAWLARRYATSAGIVGNVERSGWVAPASRWIARRWRPLA